MNNPTFTIDIEKKSIEFNLNGGARGLKGDTGEAGVSPIVTLEKSGNNLTISVTDAEGTKSETITPGDMFKSTYDTNGNGIVDNAEKVNNHTIEKDVPSNASFTDENAVWGNISGTLSSQTDLQSALDSKANTSSLSSYSLITETGNKIELEINSSTYVLVAKLYDKNNNLISTSSNIDLPLETMVVGASYDDTTKSIILTLKNGQTISFSVADLVSGLQTEITSNNKLSADLVDDTNTTNKFVSSSDITNWNSKVGTTDYASSSKGGVIKTSTTVGGTGMSGANLIGIPINYNYYSNTADNYFIISKGTLENVIAGKGLVSDTDYATTSTGGVIKINKASYGVDIDNNGLLRAMERTYEQYINSLYGSGFISKTTLENVITGKQLVNQTYVDNIVGDINTALDTINGEVI